MKFSAAALVAGYLAVTAAFLIPPDAPPQFQDLRFKDASPEQAKDLVHTLLQEQTTELDVFCPGCPWAEKILDNGMVAWDEEYYQTAVHLEFSTHRDTLVLNGETIFSLKKAPVGRVRAHQVNQITDEISPELPLNYAVEVLPFRRVRDEEIILTPVVFTVLGLNNVPMALDSVLLKLVQVPSGELVLVDTEIIPFDQTPGAQTCTDAQNWGKCRFKAMKKHMKLVFHSSKSTAQRVFEWIAKQLHRAGCKKIKMKGKHKPHKMPKTPFNTLGNGVDPARKVKPPHPKHKHHHHRLSHVLHQTIRFFIIPALLGVIGGLIASAIGMLVGQAIIFIWFKAYRRGRRGPLRLQDVDTMRKQDAQDDAKTALLDSPQEKPPQYEDAPSYEEQNQQQDNADADIEANAAQIMHQQIHQQHMQRHQELHQQHLHRHQRQ